MPFVHSREIQYRLTICILSSEAMISDFIHSPQSLLFFSIEVRVSKVQEVRCTGVQVYGGEARRIHRRSVLLTVAVITDSDAWPGKPPASIPPGGAAKRPGHHRADQTGLHRSRILRVRWKGTC